MLVPTFCLGELSLKWSLKAGRQKRGNGEELTVLPKNWERVTPAQGWAYLVGHWESRGTYRHITPAHWNLEHLQHLPALPTSHWLKSRKCGSTQSIILHQDNFWRVLEGTFRDSLRGETRGQKELLRYVWVFSEAPSLTQLSFGFQELCPGVRISWPKND